MTAVVIVEGLAILLLSVLVLGLLRSHALILRALDELGAGLELERDAQDTNPGTGPGAAGGHPRSRGHGSSSGEPTSRSGSPGPVLVDLESGVMPASRPETEGAHDLVGSTLDGGERIVAVRGGRTLLAFLTSGCSVCQTFWDEFAAGRPDVPGGGELLIVAKEDDEESPSALRRLAGAHVDVLRSSGAWVDYEIPGSPYFVYVDDGVITGEGSATSWAQVRDLMAQAVDDAEERRRGGSAMAVTPSPGPGFLVGGGGHSSDDRTPVSDRGPRDDRSRIDRELLDAGLTPGHASFYQPPDQ